MHKPAKGICMSNVIPSLRELIAERQHNRILRLSFPHGDGPASQLLVNRLEAREYLSRDFQFTVELISDNATLELKSLQGLLFSVQLVRQDGTLRYFTGFCFRCCLKRVDGAFAFYAVDLGPWFRMLSLRKDNYLFHNMTLREQTESIFNDYGSLADWDWRVAGEGKKLTDACQFDESDHNYLSRRWEAAGLTYWFEHSPTGHKLILTDDTASASPIDGTGEIAFQRHGGSAEENGLAEWSPTRTMTPGSVTLATFNFKRPRQNFQNLSEVPTTNEQGAVPDIESYEYLGAYGAVDCGDGDRKARLRMEEMEAAGKYFNGVGNNRYVAPGRWFSLTGHFADNEFGEDHAADQNEFLITDAQHSATNNYLQSRNAAPHYANSISCVRKKIAWRPGRDFNSTDTRILAPQTATVVGPTGPDSIHVDQYGRVRVQFHWDRVGEYDDKSSAWVRVLSQWAGSELGAAAIPRVGSEVCVLFLDGNPDRPVIVAGIPNEINMPPWSLPSAQALTGVRSRELAPDGGNASGGRSNHLIFDDTHQAIQTQLKSDHAHSQLSLGHIARIDDNAGRKEERGEGWELASEAWGVARAGKGMLLTTESRPNAASHIKDMGETSQRLGQATELHESLANLSPNEPDQDAIVAALQTQEASIRGEGSNIFPELAEPHLVLASPAGIELTTAQSTHIASARHAAVTTGESLSIASRGSLFASIGKKLRFFVQKAGMQFIAANGKIQVEAKDDEINLIAEKVLALLSETDWVEIRGKKGIRLHGANSMLEIGDQVQFCTSTPVLFNGSLETLAPKSVSQAINESTTARFDQEVRFLGPDNLPASNIAYELIHEDGHLIAGKTDSSGSTVVQKGTGMDSYTIRYKGELP
jgi:type VI secretion system secreted protein VgrG